MARITPGMFLKSKSNGFMYRVLEEVVTDQLGRIVVAEVATPHGRAGEPVAALPVEISHADFTATYEASTADAWLKLLGDRADRDGPTWRARR